MYSLSDVNELLARSNYLQQVIQLRNENRHLMDQKGLGGQLEKTLTHINEACKATRLSKGVIRVACEPYFV